MDGATTTVVILIFVFSIIGAVTNKQNVPPRTINQYETTQPEVVHTTVEVSIPGSDFASGMEDGLSNKILNFIVNYRGGVKVSDAQSITESIMKYSKQYDVNPKLVTALMARESGFNKFAISSSGAQGLGQLLPSTASGLGVTDPFDIEENTKGTVRYIKSMLDRFKGEQNQVPYAIAGYFEGPNSVSRKGGFKPKSKSYIEDILKMANSL